MKRQTQYPHYESSFCYCALVNKEQLKMLNENCMVGHANVTSCSCIATLSTVTDVKLVNVVSRLCRL